MKIFVVMFNRLKTRTPKAGTLVNGENPDEMLNNVAFHHGLHCLLKQNQSSKKEM